jgi:ATP-binding cassette subfamily B protein
MAEDDTKEKPKRIDARLLWRIIVFLKPYRHWVGIAFVTVITAAFLGPLRPKIVQVAIDEYILQGDMQGLTRICLILVGILMAEGVLSFVNGYMTQWIGQQAIFDLRNRVYNHILRQSLKFFNTNPIGRLITRVTSDVEALSNVLSAGVVTILGDLFRLFFIAYFMFSLNWVLALVTLAVLPLMIRVTFWFRSVVRDQYRETRKQVARLNSFMQEHISGMSIVQLFGREKDESEKFTDINNDHRVAQIKTIFYFALFWPAIDLVASIALGLVIWVGGVRALGAHISVGVLIAFIQYARQFFEPIRNLSDQYNTLQSAMAGAERIFDLLDEDIAIKEKEVTVPVKQLSGSIEFRNVWFSYDTQSGSDSALAVPPDIEDSVAASVESGNGSPAGLNVTDGQEKTDTINWVLRDVSFTVQPGQTIAIVGATGAGKSTIISLLLRFYDIQKGSILVDGVDIKEYALADLRSHIGLVLQDVFLFSGTVEKNLTLGDESIPIERVYEAAKQIGADRFIERLPEGYQQDVKERGVTLSYGQRQMLSFVRALVYNPEVLVLDEATSSVDTQTEEAIQTALSELVSNRTSIIIAHRLSTVQHANQILVMHRGQIRESGTHQQLISMDGLYRRLYELQYREQKAA